jgi:lipid-binding SYLF domain-containing protein
MEEPELAFEKEAVTLIHSRCHLGIIAAMAFSAMVTFTARPAGAADFSDAQQLVEKARLTWETFAASPVMSSELHDWLRGAKGVFILPQVIRGAAVFGAAGGRGVFLARDAKTGEWSDPAFYSLQAISFGLQIGGDVSEVIMIAWNTKGVENFYRNKFKLGIDTGVAAGPVGGAMAVGGLTADLFVYALSKGAFVGAAADGGRIAVSDKFNNAYYRHVVRPTDILVKRSVSNPDAQGLRDAVSKGMR